MLSRLHDAEMNPLTAKVLNPTVDNKIVTNEITLSQLKAGKSAEILKIQGESELKNRLASLGFIRGTRVEVSHSAIMGGPRSYRVRGSQISLRKSEADNIIIKTE